MQHPQQIEIAPHRWERWTEAAVALGDVGIGLALELKDARRDPTRHMLGRAAHAARMIETITSGDPQRLANLTATEIENDIA